MLVVRVHNTSDYRLLLLLLLFMSLVLVCNSSVLDLILLFYQRSLELLLPGSYLPREKNSR